MRVPYNRCVRARVCVCERVLRFAGSLDADRGKRPDSCIRDCEYSQQRRVADADTVHRACVRERCNASKLGCQRPRMLG